MSIKSKTEGPEDPSNQPNSSGGEPVSKNNPLAGNEPSDENAGPTPPSEKKRRRKSKKVFDPEKDDHVERNGVIYVLTFWDCRYTKPNCSCVSKKHSAFFPL